jgi:hypothetical protein
LRKLGLRPSTPICDDTKQRSVFPSGTGRLAEHTSPGAVAHATGGTYVRVPFADPSVCATLSAAEFPRVRRRDICPIHFRSRFGQTGKCSGAGCRRVPAGTSDPAESSDPWRPLVQRCALRLRCASLGPSGRAEKFRSVAPGPLSEPMAPFSRWGEFSPTGISLPYCSDRSFSSDFFALPQKLGGKK